MSRKVNRSSESGKFVDAETAQVNPATTQGETIEKKPFRKIELAMFTGETRPELAQQIRKRLQLGFLPVTDVLVIQLSKLGGDIEDGYLQIFAKKK